MAARVQSLGSSCRANSQDDREGSSPQSLLIQGKEFRGVDVIASVPPNASHGHTDEWLLNSTLTNIPLHPELDDTSQRPVTSFREVQASSWVEGFWEKNRCCLLVAISAVFQSAMALFTKILELGDESLSTSQILFMRMTATTVWCTATLRWHKVPNYLAGPKGMGRLLLLRGISGFVGIYFFWAAIRLLSLADATVVTFLAPLMVGFYSAIFLGQPFSRDEKLASLVALVGVVFIARPSLLFSLISTHGHSSPPNVAVARARGGNMTTPDTAQGYGKAYGNASSRWLGLTFALLSALGSTGALATIRAIGGRCHVLITTNYFAACCTLISATALSVSPATGYHQHQARFGLPHDVKQWMLVLMVTICGFLTQWFVTAGIGSEQGSSKAPAMTYTAMFWTAAFDWLYFGQTMDWSGLVGCCLVVGSAVWIVLMPKPRPGDSRSKHDAVDEESAKEDREWIPLQSVK